MKLPLAFALGVLTVLAAVQVSAQYGKCIDEFLR